MKKKWKVALAGILVYYVVIMGWIVIDYAFYCYDTPELALQLGTDKSTKYRKECECEQIISTVWLDENQPLTFYLNPYGDVCKIQNEKVYIFDKFGKAKWRKGTPGLFPDSIKDIKIDSLGLIGYTFRTDDANIVYGLTKLSNPETIRVDGKTPTLHKVAIDEEEYTIWYVINDRFTSAEITYGDGKVKRVN